MIDPNTAFSLASLLALIAWIPLLIALFVPAMRRRTWQATGLAVPGIIAIAYVALIVAGIKAAGGTDFGSLAEIRRVFANDAALAAGWLHYLAFDMVVGTWIARDGTRRGIPALLLLPCAVMTFLFGPAGLLLYLIARTSLGRSPGNEGSVA
jgi:hypothetical protein